MKKIFRELYPILLCIFIIALSIIILLHFVHDYPSSKLNDWANFATYLGISMSLISAIFIYLTYRSQTNMSSILQFESTFFQWYQVHNQLLEDLKPAISECVQDIIIPKLRKDKLENLTAFEDLAQKEIPRPIHRYYKSTYQLLRYIQVSPILSYYSQRKKYFDIIQAHLTDDELIVLLCFVLGDVNRDKTIINKISHSYTFKDIVDKSHFLKNCYIEENLRTKITPIIRQNFPQTANSFHFFR